jgi:hypothetical protein
MSGWAWFWLVWVLVGLVVELVAVARPEAGDSFTDNWRWIRDRLGPLAVLWVGGTALGIVWLFGHFVLEAW